MAETRDSRITSINVTRAGINYHCYLKWSLFHENNLRGETEFVRINVIVRSEENIRAHDADFFTTC